MKDSKMLIRLNDLVFNEDGNKVTEIQMSLSPLAFSSVKWACANAAANEIIWNMQELAGQMLEQLENVTDEIWHKLMCDENESAIDNY